MLLVKKCKKKKKSTLAGSMSWNVIPGLWCGRQIRAFTFPRATLCYIPLGEERRRDSKKTQLHSHSIGVGKAGEDQVSESLEGQMGRECSWEGNSIKREKKNTYALCVTLTLFPATLILPSFLSLFLCKSKVFIWSRGRLCDWHISLLWETISHGIKRVLESVLC